MPKPVQTDFIFIDLLKPETKPTQTLQKKKFRLIQGNDLEAMKNDAVYAFGKLSGLIQFHTRKIMKAEDCKIPEMKETLEEYEKLFYEIQNQIHFIEGLIEG